MWLVIVSYYCTVYLNTLYSRRVYSLRSLPQIYADCYSPVFRCNLYHDFYLLIVYFAFSLSSPGIKLHTSRSFGINFQVSSRVLI